MLFAAAVRTATPFARGDLFVRPENAVTAVGAADAAANVVVVDAANCLSTLVDGGKQLLAA